MRDEHSEQSSQPHCNLQTSIKGVLLLLYKVKASLKAEVYQW